MFNLDKSKTSCVGKTITLWICCWSLCAALFSTPFAHAESDRIAIIINEDLKGLKLGRKEIINLYSGRKRKVIDGNIVNLYETGEKELKNIFLSEVLGMSVREYHLIWARHLFSGRFKQHTKLYSDNDIIAAVNANPGSIGYVFEDSVQEISHVLFYFDPASSHGIKVN